MDYTLAMTFINNAGDKVSISVTGVKPDITQAEVTTLMDTILAKDIFLSKGGALTSKYGAQLTQRAVTKFEVS
jgi:hypothetical protein